MENTHTDASVWRVNKKIPCCHAPVVDQRLSHKVVRAIKWYKRCTGLEQKCGNTESICLILYLLKYGCSLHGRYLIEGGANIMLANIYVGYYIMLVGKNIKRGDN